MSAIEAESVRQQGQKGERLVFAAVLLLSLGFGGATLKGTYTQRQAERAAEKGRTLRVAPTTVIGPRPSFKGDPNSPYTLTEFGDYQCPPCRATHQRLSDVLKRYQGKVRFVFRNFPLTSIHPQALPAAIAAEAAREQGRFWPMHKALFETELSAKAIEHIVRAQKLDALRFKRSVSNSAKRVVQNDIEQVKKLDLNSTPSFILCFPDGRVMRLQSLEELSDYTTIYSKSG